MLVSVFVVFFFCSTGYSQQWINFYDSKMNRNKPFLISNIGSNNQDDGGEKLFHTIEQAYSAFMDDHEFSLALRVCSPYPLPIVFTSPQYSPSPARIAIERFSSEINGIKLERVFLLRNDKNCAYNQKHLITEYWLVPKDSDFPEFVEIAKITDFPMYRAETSGKYKRKSLIDSFKSVGELISPEHVSKHISLTPSNYLVFKNNLLRLLRKDKFSFVLIEYPNHGKSRKAIFNQAVGLKQFLTKNNIRKGRIVIKPCDLSECEFDSDNKHQIYPNITSVYQN